MGRHGKRRTPKRRRASRTVLRSTNWGVEVRGQSVQIRLAVKDKASHPLPHAYRQALDIAPAARAPGYIPTVSQAS